MLGKRSAVTVHSSEDRPKLFLDLQSTGELKLRLADMRPRRGEPLGSWNFTGSVLERTVPLPPAYQVLAQGEMTLSRTELARFYEYELPSLEKHVDVTTNDAFEHLDFTKAAPHIRATLDGVLEGLSVRLEAVYGTTSFPLQGAPKAASDAAIHWVPDPANPLQYWSRDMNAETRAQRQVIAAGFEPDIRWPEMYTLRSENRGGSFLANILPKWRAQWDVVFGNRMQAFLAKCEIVEPEIAIRPAGEDWLSVDVKFKNPGGNSTLTPADVQHLLQKGMSHLRLGKDRVALVPTDAMHEWQEVIVDCDAQQSGTDMKIDRRYGSYLGEALRDAQLSIAPESKWKPPAKVTELEKVALPELLAQQLRPYQRDGVNWLQHLSQNGLGGVLADEMGLGKTIQTLACLATRRGTGKKPSLVICPTSLITNWQAEAARFTPGLKTLMLHGPKRQALFSEIPKHDLIITSYALMRRDTAVYAPLEFDTVILDEAQHIKNPFSQNAQAAKTLRADHRFVLTGTPMENSLTDLWSIFDFLMPGYLGRAADFKDRYEVPIAKAGDQAALRRLRQRLRPFVLRRTKAEVARDLPAKLEQVAFCEMSEEQKSAYQAILEHGRREVFEHAGKGGQAQQRMAVLTTLTRLRQACCHLDLLPRVENRPWNEPSAKLDLCLELIDEAISGGHRVLVFSQFVKLLQLIVTALREREIPFCYLDGSTIDRQGEVRRFQETEIPVFLISLKAGGTGLNLTGADTVIHFDPWWNPAVEDQATARAHRIGQSNIVTSYKLIAQGSVEEKIVRLQEKKKDLIASALTSDEAFTQSLTWDELQGLLT
jgi:superfamily II DNA or RNA helicase